MVVLVEMVLPLIPAVVQAMVVAVLDLAV